jgi:hypothetical protein
VNTTQIVLAGEPAASMALAAERACAVPELPLAIIGGFAVTCRLGHVHRATGDVDAVADELATVGAEGSSAQALVERGIARRDPGGRDHRVFVDGTKLEIIDTQALTDDVDDIESALDRLFLLGHRWALDSAELLRITVAGSDSDVMLPIATPAALVATKLHAFCDRPRDEKRASDAYDIFRLVESYDRDGGVADTLNKGPRGLAEVVHELAAERLVESAERVIRYLKVYGEPIWSEISAADIRRVLGSLVSRLRD